MNRAALIAASTILISAFSVSANAHIIWGGGGTTPPDTIVDAATVSAAASLAFSQNAPTLTTDTGSIPATASNTQFAVMRVANVDGTARVVLLLRYANGSVYAIANSDTNLAALAANANANDTVEVTSDFSFATENGQTVVRQKLIVNGTVTYTTWGRSSSIVNSFTMPDGTCRHIIWGGGGTIDDTETGEPG
jgi:hypothetical protein